jgi:hypothetical protein
VTCARCGIHTPRLTLAQRYCPPCQREVDAIVAADTRRRMPRFSVAKSLDRSPA